MELDCDNCLKEYEIKTLRKIISEDGNSYILLCNKCLDLLNSYSFAKRTTT